MMRGLIAGLSLAAAPAEACRLALVLAIDVSSSVDATEDALQRQGLAAALIAPEVQAAFFASSDPVALYVFEWSGRYNQVALSDWRMIETPGDLDAVAAAVSSSIRSHNDFPTAMGHALGHAATVLQNGPRCLFQTIDMAGDGINNEGFGPIEAYDAFPLGDVTVNGLVVNAADFEGEVNLIPFYTNEVIRGPGAFVEVANSFADYETAMRRKLVRELGVIGLSGWPAAADRSPS
ncbi:hypothetical protein AN189_12005 [Loktanella sp. 3ANDIMAR09]|uniref:DUF1194 domain-containing protein n=1 Tax=Loktanella sp. 3ANDIMAR09 TaxID=1225657 RepID=UPI0006F8F169|nr:DUF1194 domain-containing protein [Loktanella sp. 3ANDIMAR09]KQI68125.1 hypothetical protein AN189_12005 [Loktanella sp. 3ANDIMAR09]